MNSAGVAEIMKNIGDIGLVGKYNSGSLTPMGLNGPVASPFLGIPEVGASYLAPVIKGGKRPRKSRGRKRKTRKTRRKSQRRK